MPNWVKNVISFPTKEELEKALAKIGVKNEEDFSFEKIIPSPKTKEDCPKEYLLKKEDMVAPDDERPWFNWYSWNNNNWSTKWDACEAMVENSAIWFDTAWSAPFPILSKLMELWKDFDFDVKGAEETGAYVYHIQHEKGSENSILTETSTFDDDEGKEIYKEIWNEIFEEDEDEDDE